MQSATAGSLAAFMTLLAQNRLVSPQASAEMSELMRRMTLCIFLKLASDKLSNRDREHRPDRYRPNCHRNRDGSWETATGGIVLLPPGAPWIAT